MVEFIETRQGSRVRAVTIGDGPPVLALHGLGGGSYFFEGCAFRLARTCRMIAPDLPGTGGSTSAGAPTLEIWIADLVDVLLRQAGVPAIVVGHSLGTILALELWRRAPEAVRAMAFVGGLPRPRQIICERLRQRAQIAKRHGMAGLGLQVAPGVFSAATIARAPETVAFFARLFDAQPAESYLASLAILVGADATPVVSTVTVPTVSISGADDQYAPPEDVAAFTAALARSAPPIVLPDVGHLPFFEAPEAFARLLGEWIDGL